MRRWSFWLMVLVLVGLLAAAACAGEKEASPALTLAPTGKAAWEEEWSRTVEAAKKEGKVVVAGQSGSDRRQALSEGFEKQYGITVEYVGDGTTLAERIRTERAAGQYQWDLLIGGFNTPLDVLRPVGALDPIEPALIMPDAKDLKNWRGGKLTFADEGRLALRMVGTAGEAIHVNTKVVKPEDFTSYRDLLNPKWKGKMLAFDPATRGPGQLKFLFFYVSPDLGPDFIRQLARQDMTITRDEESALKWLIAEQYSICIGCSTALSLKLIEAGLPLKLVGPERFKEGTYLSPGWANVSLINRAPHPNAAKVYLNWLLSRDAQTAVARAGNYASLRLDVPTDHLDSWAVPKEGMKIIDLGTEATQKKLDDMGVLLKEVFPR